MRTVPASPTQAAQPCPSPITVWQSLLTYLLTQHYGLTLNDTAFSDDAVIQAHLDDRQLSSDNTLNVGKNFTFLKQEL